MILNNWWQFRHFWLLLNFKSFVTDKKRYISRRVTKRKLKKITEFYTSPTIKSRTFIIILFHSQSLFATPFKQFILLTLWHFLSSPWKMIFGSQERHANTEGNLRNLSSAHVDLFGVDLKALFSCFVFCLLVCAF